MDGADACTGGPRARRRSTCSQVQERPDPEPGPGQLLVEVAASGVNFIDVYQREGVYPVADAVRPRRGVRRPGRRGRRRASPTSRSATWSRPRAGSARTPSARWSRPTEAVPVPDGVDPELAAAAMLQGMTAHYLVQLDVPGAATATTVLVHAAAGGVGQLLVQLVKAKGGAGDRDGRQRARRSRSRRDAGADEVIRYDEVDDLAAAVRDLVPDGVHVAYDGVGQATFDASLGVAAAARDARAVRRGERPGAAVRPAAAQLRRARCSSPVRRSRTTPPTARSCSGGPARSSARSPTGRCASRSAAATRSTRRRRPTATSRAARTTGKLLVVPKPVTVPICPIVPRSDGVRTANPEP